LQIMVTPTSIFDFVLCCCFCFASHLNNDVTWCHPSSAWCLMSPLIHSSINGPLFYDT
jgi:hypothetical protein